MVATEEKSALGLDSAQQASLRNRCGELEKYRLYPGKLAALRVKVVRLRFGLSGRNGEVDDIEYDLVAKREVT